MKVKCGEWFQSFRQKHQVRLWSGDITVVSFRSYEAARRRVRNMLPLALKTEEAQSLTRNELL